MSSPPSASPTREADPHSTVAWYKWRRAETNANFFFEAARHRGAEPGSGIGGLQGAQARDRSDSRRIAGTGERGGHRGSACRDAVGQRILRRGTKLLAL